MCSLFIKSFLSVTLSNNQQSFCSSSANVISTLPSSIVDPESFSIMLPCRTAWGFDLILVLIKHWRFIGSERQAYSYYDYYFWWTTNTTISGSSTASIYPINYINFYGRLIQSHHHLILIWVKEIVKWDRKKPWRRRWTRIPKIRSSLN